MARRDNKPNGVVLRTCPHCGHRPKLEQRTESELDYMVRCGCGVMMLLPEAVQIDGARRFAAAYWNRRTAEEAVR